MPIELPRENIYGHFQRLEWIRDHIETTEQVVEFGCGTGYMITLPLRSWGYNVIGIDLDQKSVEYGQRLFKAMGDDDDAVSVRRLEEIHLEADVIVASEVLEHLSDEELPEILDLFHRKLGQDGLLLVTVPNGYGWFELESFLWFKIRLGPLFERVGFVALWQLLKRGLIGEYEPTPYLSTLAVSPHLQRFTLRTICQTLERARFRVVETRGSVVLCGPFSDVFLTGFRRVMKTNARLGRRFPALAAGFYLVAEKR
jgi:SAM-dependent methyltransferase